ncbi:hypothetical protein FQR65_LT13302 [Abscondita terminalis]|nr:hypothetical protein FQR65_LT13302 [Abscondita terminalis]
MFLGIRAFIIPDEVPSLLSVIYSNIPTIKKGTDSRLGWGFRLGNRADFQQLLKKHNPKWIDQWRESVQVAKQKQEVPDGAKPGLALGEIDAKSVIPDDSSLMLEKLYQMGASQKTKKETSA